MEPDFEVECGSVAGDVHTDLASIRVGSHLLCPPGICAVPGGKEEELGVARTQLQSGGNIRF